MISGLSIKRFNQKGTNRVRRETNPRVLGMKNEKRKMKNEEMDHFAHLTVVSVTPTASSETFFILHFSLLIFHSSFLYLFITF
jgi:hypothetical protein